VSVVRVTKRLESHELEFVDSFKVAELTAGKKTETASFSQQKAALEREIADLTVRLGFAQKENADLKVRLGLAVAGQVEGGPDPKVAKVGAPAGPKAENDEAKDVPEAEGGNIGICGFITASRPPRPCRRRVKGGGRCRDHAMQNAAVAASPGP
jgi:hypothetical protein